MPAGSVTCGPPFGAERAADARPASLQAPVRLRKARESIARKLREARERRDAEMREDCERDAREMREMQKTRESAERREEDVSVVLRV